MFTYLPLLYAGRHCTLSFTASYSLFSVYFSDPSSAASINGFFSLASGLARPKHLDYVLLTVWKCSVMPWVMFSLYILRRTIFLWGHIRILKASVKFMCSERSSWWCFYMQPDFYSGHISCSSSAKKRSLSRLSFNHSNLSQSVLGPLPSLGPSVPSLWSRLGLGSV